MKVVKLQLAITLLLLGAIEADRGHEGWQKRDQIGIPVQGADQQDRTEVSGKYVSRRQNGQMDILSEQVQIQPDGQQRIWLQIGSLLKETSLQNEAHRRHENWQETDGLSQKGTIHMGEKYGNERDTDATKQDSKVAESIADESVQSLKKRGLPWPQCLGCGPSQTQVKDPRSKECYCSRWCERCSRSSPERKQLIGSLPKCEARTGKCCSVVKQNGVSGEGADRKMNDATGTNSLVRAPSVTGADPGQNGVSGTPRRHQGQGNEQKRRRVKERPAADSRDGGAGLFVLLGCCIAAAVCGCCNAEYS